MLPPVDVRRKRPPALSFLLRMETLRRASRVVSLLALDFAGLLSALIVALMVKAVLRDGAVGVGGVAARGARDDRVRVPGHRAAVRALRPVRRTRAAPRAGADRVVAVPGRRRLADLRPGQRDARLLELLHLLRHAVLRGDHPGIGAVGLRAAHGRDPARRGLPPARRAGRHRQAHRGGRARADRRGARAGRDGRLHLARRRGRTTGCARWAGSRTSPRCSTSTACRK